MQLAALTMAAVWILSRMLSAAAVSLPTLRSSCAPKTGAVTPAARMVLGSAMLYT